jgi:hypothetical protein
MLKAKSCDCSHIKFADGEIFEKIKYGNEECEAVVERCPDCGVEIGGYHHPECDQEQCPRCNCQLIGCDCDIDGDLIYAA